MADKLVVAVLGNRNSGKSHTWNTLFGATVRTGKYERSLELNNCESADVFLVSGSPEERETYVGEIIDGQPRIVLCSMQYRPDVVTTIQHFQAAGYTFFVQWLNPGRNDSSKSADTLGILQNLIDVGATVQVRSGKADDAMPRVREIRDFIYGWASARKLVKHDAGWA